MVSCSTVDCCWVVIVFVLLLFFVCLFWGAGWFWGFGLVFAVVVVFSSLRTTLSHVQLLLVNLAVPSRKASCHKIVIINLLIKSETFQIRVGIYFI